MLLQKQIVAEICDAYHSNENSFYFPNIDGIFELEIAYMLKIVQVLNV